MRWGGLETPYFIIIGALVYLVNCIRSNITFIGSLLVKFNTKPTKWHWNGVKHILEYFSSSVDSGLFYTIGKDSNIKGYMNADHLSDPHQENFHTCMLPQKYETFYKVSGIWFIFHVLQLLPITFKQQNSCCLSKSKMKHLQTLDWKSDLPLFSYDYW